MDTLRKTIAALCAVLFVISGILALFAFNLELQAFNAAAYKTAFEKQNLYERVPAILAGALHTSAATNPTSDPFLKALTVEDWQRTVVLLLPPQDLKAITDFALDSLFDYLNRKTDTAVLTLTPLKSNLVGPAGTEIARQILSAQPACTAEQLLQMGLGFLSGDITLCNPPPEMLGLMTPVLESQIQILSASIPNEITLLASAPGTATGDPRARLDRTRTLMKVIPVFPVLFLFCITILMVRSLSDWLKWWGYPFLFTGAGSLLLALIGAPLVGWVVRYFLQTQGASFIPSILFSTMQETVSTVTGEILSPVAIEGGALALLGLGMVVVALLLAYRNRQVSR